MTKEGKAGSIARCVNCGSASFEPGIIEEELQIHFTADENRQKAFRGLRGLYLPVAATRCTKCGHLDLFANKLDPGE